MESIPSSYILSTLSPLEGLFYGVERQFKNPVQLLFRCCGVYYPLDIF